MGGIIKVIFTILFVTVFYMTVEGATLSTILSNIVASTLAFLALSKSKAVHILYKRI